MNILLFISTERAKVDLKVRKINNLSVCDKFDALQLAATTHNEVKAILRDTSCHCS